MRSTISSDLAAQYVRMSTDHQRYSIDNQIEAIRHYADREGYALVRTYADAGRSGLQLKNRPGLKRLLADVEGGEANYRTIIVYDVSRWGRFQDTDEAAYYEHLCRRHGVSVAYCGEAFDTYSGALKGIAKAMKRFMAAEFSRELSRKTYRGQARIASLGFRTGGTAGVGYRRLLVDGDREPKATLEHGEYKALHTDRVVLTPGPASEVALIREIFDRYLRGGSCWGIAIDLNERRVPSYGGGRWYGCTVQEILKNPRYVGDAVFARTSKKLGAAKTANPPEQWIRAPGWQGIIDHDTFDRVQEEMRTRHSMISDDELLERLKDLYAREGRITAALIDADPRLPSRQYVATCFGSTHKAYKAAGYPGGRAIDPDSPPPGVVLRRQVRGVVLAKLRDAGHPAQERSSRIAVYGKSYSVIAVSRDRDPRHPSWTRHLGDRDSLADVSIALRMSDDGTQMEDIWLLPRQVIGSYITLAPGKRLWNTTRRYPDAESAAEALERYVATTAAP